MTAIAGWIDDEGVVWIGGDSGGADEDTVFPRSDEKVFKVGNYLIGFSESFRGMQLLKYGSYNSTLNLKNIKPSKSKEKTHEFMVKFFIPMVRNIFRDGGFMSSHKGSEYFDGSFLVGVNGCLFMVDGDFQVGIHDKFTAIGSGYHLCIGSMHTSLKYQEEEGLDHLSGEEVVLTALESAAEYSNCVLSPFIIKNEKSK